jgi:ABC-type transporter Mla subunit MlaD
MITRRIIVNLIAFGLLAAVLVLYGYFDLLGNPFAQRTNFSTVLPTSAGLAPNFNVTLDGVVVGSVTSVSLVHDGVKVTMTLNPGEKVPSDVAARVAIANALGEQELQLVPTGTSTSGGTSSSGSSSSSSATQALAAGSSRSMSLVSSSEDDPAQSLRNGAVVPALPDPIPAQVGTVVAEADSLLQSIPVGSLNELLHEAAVALNGNSVNLQTIASASELFSQEFLAQQQQFESLLQNAPPALDTVTDNASALQQGLADTAVLVEVLADHSNDLVRLFSQGSNAASALQTLVTENEPNLACIIHDASDVAANLGSQPNVSNLSTALSTNKLFFGAVKSLSVTGPAISLNSRDKARDTQEWLRTGLLLPGLQVPLQPQPVQYTTPTSLPPVLPGAGCDTEFGQGVGPVTQAGFKPAGPDASMEPATSAEAQVRGGGTEPAPAASPAAARLDSDGASSVVLPLMAGLSMLGLLVTFGHRRDKRSARPLQVAARATRRRR